MLWQYNIKTQTMEVVTVKIAGIQNIENQRKQCKKTSAKTIILDVHIEDMFPRSEYRTRFC